MEQNKIFSMIEARKKFNALYDLSESTDYKNDVELKNLIKKLAADTSWLIICLKDISDDLDLHKKACEIRYDNIREDIEFEKSLTFINFIKEKLFGKKRK